jgi:hypothetical protein
MATNPERTNARKKGVVGVSNRRDLIINPTPLRFIFKNVLEPFLSINQFQPFTTSQAITYIHIPRVFNVHSGRLLVLAGNRLYSLSVQTIGIQTRRVTA